MEDSKFDIIIFGTGITESIVAAALSKWGYRVAHLDRCSYYGADEASLNLEEFASWIDTHTASVGGSRFFGARRSPNIPGFARQYSICLSPSIIPAAGPFIDTLIHSGVSKYSGFRLLDHVAVFDGKGGFKSVPSSKEDIFKNKDITLIQKRRLMRFFTFVAGDFEQSNELKSNYNLPLIDFLETVFTINKDLASIITYALAYSSGSMDPTHLVLPRIRRYLRSLGRYGPSPFLVGHYGGLGEISQGFCRTAAVNGAVYILGRDITIAKLQDLQDESSGDSASHSPYVYSVSIEDIPEALRARVILGRAPYISNQEVGEPKYIPISTDFSAAYSSTSIARCVAIVEQPIFLGKAKYTAGNDKDASDQYADDGQEEEMHSEVKAIDTSILVFPPNTLKGGSPDSSAVLFTTGDGTLSAPKGKYLLYIGLPLVGRNKDHDNPEELLRPYLDTVLQIDREAPQTPLFTAFYLETIPDIPLPSSSLDPADKHTWFIPPPIPIDPLGDVADSAARNADTAFHEIIQALHGSEERYHLDDAIEGMWPKELHE